MFTESVYRSQEHELLYEAHLKKASKEDQIVILAGHAHCLKHCCQQLQHLQRDANCAFQASSCLTHKLSFASLSSLHMVQIRKNKSCNC